MNPSQQNGPVQGEQASEVLDGELITEAEYSQRKWQLAVAAAIRESDHPKKITTAMISQVRGSVRVAARALYSVGQGHASWDAAQSTRSATARCANRSGWPGSRGTGRRWPNGPSG